MGKIDYDKIKSKTSLRQIEIVWHVYMTGSVSRTACQLRMSTANVSRTCSRFEEHFDFPIFMTRRKGVQFTREGAEVMTKVEPLALEIERFSVALSAPSSE